MFYQVATLCWALSAVLSAPTDVVPLEKQQPTVIPIISQSEELEPNGTYKFSYETGNGIKREEISFDKIVPKAQARSDASNEGEESDESDEIHVQQGSYSYTAPDGTLITVRYIADENGFQAFGDHLPRAPVLPQSSSSPADKTGRALKTPVSAETFSAPAPATKPEPVPQPAEPASQFAQNSPDAQPESSEPVSVSPAVEATSSTDDVTKSTEVAAGNEQSEPVDVAEQKSTTTASEPITEITSTAAVEQSIATSDQSTTVFEQTTSAAEQSTAAIEQTASASEQSTTAATEESSTLSADQPVSKDNVGETATPAAKTPNSSNVATNAVVEQQSSTVDDDQPSQPSSTVAAEEPAEQASTEPALQSADAASTTVSV